METRDKVRLADLLEGIKVRRANVSFDIRVSGLTKDSREVKEDYLFFLSEKNLPYLEDAKRKGAMVFVTDLDVEWKEPFVLVDDLEMAIGRISSKFFGDPSKDMLVVGITGTNGKTTTSFLIDSIFRESGMKSGLLGTLFYRYGSKTLKAPNTTPGAIELQRLLRDMKDSGVEALVMEVSSHGLSQRRVEGVNFDACAFTNLGRDHLDYHGDFESYRASKSLLFNYYLERSCKREKFAILNALDPNFPYMVPKSKVNVKYYGIKGEFDARVLEFRESLEGLEAKISVLEEEILFNSKLVGDFNLENILCASLTAKVLGIDSMTIKRGIEVFPGVPGRLERIENDKGFHVFVDYAHTPDALERVLKVLSKLKRNRLIVVFGCGGERDRGKRPIMGKVASSLSDFAFITSDNPRGEDPEAIIDEIKQGINGKNFRSIVDRKEAIFEAVKMLKDGDILVVCGKGHEDYQIVGDRVLPFNDREVLEEALGCIPMRR